MSQDSDLRVVQRIRNLPKIKTDYFVNLPYLMYDSKTKGATVKDFLKLIKINSK